MIKKKIAAVILAALSLMSAFAFSACGEEPAETETSGLSGIFTHSEAIKKDTANQDLRIYNRADATDNNLYCTVYPLNTVNGSKVCYGIDQRLKLKRDFTYNYQYTITLTNSEEWGKDFSSVSVQIVGTFTYQTTDGANYQVALQNPTEGTQTIYGANVSGEANIYAWMLSSAAGKILDVAYELSLDASFEYNRYICGRSVSVSKLEKSVADDLYYRDIMNDIAPYCSYTV